MSLMARRSEVYERRDFVQAMAMQIASPTLCVPVSTADTPESKSLVQLNLNQTPLEWTDDGQQHEQGAKEQRSMTSHSDRGWKDSFS